MPSYSPDAIRSYITDTIYGQNPNATYADIAAAAQQLGVPLEDVYSTFGMDPTQGASLLATQPLTSEQVTGARDWVNTQYGNKVNGGNGWNFDGDFTGRNVNGGVDSSLISNMLGAGMAMGYDDAGLSQIFGPNITPDVIAGARETVFGSDPAMQHDAQAMQGRLFNANFGAGDPSLVQDQYFTYKDPNTGEYVSVPREGLSYNDRQNLRTSGVTNPAGGSGGGWRDAGSGGGRDDWRDARRAARRGETTPTTPGTQQPGTPYPFSPNPYLQQMGNTITGQVNDNLMQNILPSIRGSFNAMGGQGGSRQGIAEGQAIGDSSQALSGALANLYGGAYESQAGRDLQRYGVDLGYNTAQRNLDLGFLNSDRSYDLGLRGNELGWGTLGANYQLGNQGQMLNFWDSERDNDRQDLGMGMSLWGMGSAGPWGPISNYGDLLTGIGGQNNNSSSGGQSGGGWGGALGGGLMGMSLWNQLNKSWA